ncbi:MAG: carboxyl-terminal processing protease [Flavobacteriaceae bacterium]|jgi:carboxyl-terminal processing protease
MIKLILLLTTTLFIHFEGASLDDGIGDRAKRLVDYFKRNHYNPRSLDSQLGHDLNALLVDYLDDSYLYFYQSDIHLLATSSDSLHLEIRSRSINHLELFERLFLVRVAEAEKIVNELFDHGEYVLHYEGTIVPAKEYVSGKVAFDTRWKNYVTKSIHDHLFDNLGADETLENIDLPARCKESIAAIRANFDRYFESLEKTDDYFESMYINCIAWCYDPHSNYFNENVKDDFTEELSSERRLFGISYNKTSSGTIEISGITPGSSAWYTDGISAGDELLTITSSEDENIDVSNSTLADLRSFFDDLTSDSLTLTVISDGEEREVQLVKNVVYSDEDIIKAARLDGDKNIGYISLPDFYTNWTDTSSLGCANDVAKSLIRLNKSGIDGMILDLRDNGGGSIREAIDLVGIFINYGPVVIEVDNNGEAYTHKDFHRGSIYRGPLVVLINSNSASASEIVAAGLQDYNRALIVGQKSYGKATGQIVVPLDPKHNNITRLYREEDVSWGYTKITQIGLYRITKKSAQLNGVIPDIHLNSLSLNPSNYESDYKHTIVLDSVDKKVYYTPKAELPIGSIKTYYDGVKEPIMKGLQLLTDSITDLADKIDLELSIQGSYNLIQLLDDMIERYSGLQDGIEFAYSPVSFQFKESLLKISPFLSDYSAHFIKELETDIELNEAYKIIQGLIKATE